MGGKTAAPTIIGLIVTSEKRIKSISILHYYRTKCQTCAETNEAHLHSTPEHALFNSIIQSYGNRCAGSIAVHIYVGEELVHRNTEVLCGGLDDSDVCLMRDKEVDVVYVKTNFLSSISCGSGKSLCSELVNFLAVLNEEPVVNGLVGLIINNRMLCC